MDLIKNIKNLEQDLIKWRRDLHKIPEIGNNLPLTSKYVKNILDKLGVEYRTNFSNDSSFLVTIKGNQNSKKCIALRADMDGLPIKEQLDLDFKSTNENMHACGHDAHTAIMLTVIRVLNENKDKLNGTVKILLQPGEETSTGALPMIEAGALDGVDFILGLHNGNVTDELNDGEMGVKYGPMLACMDKFYIKVIGKGSHGAFPQDSFDPIIMTGHIITGLQELISREINAIDSAVVSICSVQGGKTFNIIPDYVELLGTVRAHKKEIREYIVKRIEEISNSISATYRGKIEYKYTFGPPPVINTDRCVDFALESAKKAIGEKNVKILQHPVMAGEDFSYYLEKIPGAYVFLKNPLYVDGVAYPHHNCKFGVNEKYFINGVKFFVQAVVDYLK